MATVESIIARPAAVDSLPRSLPSAPTPLRTTEQAAERLGLAPKTLEKDRCTRSIGVPFVKLGKTVRYRDSDLDAFIASKLVGRPAQ